MALQMSSGVIIHDKISEKEFEVKIHFVANIYK